MSAEPKKSVPAEIRVQDVITVTARLAQLLAEEADLLGDMKVARIEALQQEKLFLTSALEAQKRMIAKQPDLIETIPSQDKRELQEVVDIFNAILEENHRKLLMAKEVNLKIVEAITDVVTKSSKIGLYNDNGGAQRYGLDVLSITLNKTV